MPHDWWRDFFRGAPVRFWHAIALPEQTRREVDFVTAALAPEAGARLLDVPCGSGRHSIQLARAGFHMVAQDLSDDFLQLARQAVAAAGVAVELRHGDMRELPADPPFDGAMCLGNSFGYLDDAGNAAFLAAVCRTLRPGRSFVMEAAVSETVLPHFMPRRWFEADGIHFLSEVTHDPTSGRLRSDYTLLYDGTVDRRTAWVRLHSARELIDLLAAAGFRRAEVRGPEGRPLAYGDQRAWFVAVA